MRPTSSAKTSPRSFRVKSACTCVHLAPTGQDRDVVALVGSRAYIRQESRKAPR